MLAKTFMVLNDDGGPPPKTVSRARGRRPSLNERMLALSKGIMKTYLLCFMVARAVGGSGGFTRDSDRNTPESLDFRIGARGDSQPGHDSAESRRVILRLDSGTSDSRTDLTTLTTPMTNVDEVRVSRLSRC